jgi:hypothetical protein
MAVNRIYCATGLGDGVAPDVDGELDTIDGADLADKDMAIVIDQTTVYFFALDSDSAAAHSSPNVISPTNNAGDKRWILQSLRANDLTLSDDIILAADDVKIGDFLEVVGSVQVGDADGTGGNLTLYSDTAGDFVKFDKTTKTFTLTDIDLNATTMGATTPGSIVGGGLVITDGDIADTGILTITPTTSLQVQGAGALGVGTDDTTRGYLSLYGFGAGQTGGGVIDLYTAADHDTTINLYRHRHRCLNLHWRRR